MSTRILFAPDIHFARAVYLMALYCFLTNHLLSEFIRTAAIYEIACGFESLAYQMKSAETASP